MQLMPLTMLLPLTSPYDDKGPLVFFDCCWAHWQSALVRRQGRLLGSDHHTVALHTCLHYQGNSITIATLSSVNTDNHQTIVKYRGQRPRQRFQEISNNHVALFLCTCIPYMFWIPPCVLMKQEFDKLHKILWQLQIQCITTQPIRGIQLKHDHILQRHQCNMKSLSVKHFLMNGIISSQRLPV